ncbi:MAG TPA: chemotaxis protein CheA [Longimicrobiales bacterium]|nr:chemotaxis protein CheA [Longimicrobiales bacterium]
MNPPTATAKARSNPAAPPDRMGAIDEAALALAGMAGPRPDAGELEHVRALLEPRARDDDQPAWVRQALAAAVELLDGALDGAGDPACSISRVNALLDLTRSAAPHAAGDVPAGMALPDDTIRELVPEFLAESAEHLDHVEAILLRTGAARVEPADLEDIFRAFHTIKGSASFLGAAGVAELAHAGESLLDRLRGATDIVGPASTAPVMECVDVLRRLLDDFAYSSAGASSPASASASSPASASAAHPPPSRAATAAPPATVRVRTDRLDELVELVGELVVAHAMVGGDALVHRHRHDELGRNVARTGKIVRQLQDLASALRMVPLRPLFQRMERLARDLGSETGKPVEFVSTGADTEIDRTMVDLLADPLVHMIRNAMDHGVEQAEARAAAGKPVKARICLSAWHSGGDVMVELADDGRGLDLRGIRARAEAYGRVLPDQPMTAEEVAGLIFESGLSTSDTVTTLSGRGVGMDVVRRNIEALRGRIDVRSEDGAGTTFRIRLPLTLAVTDGMLVRVGAERYVIPSSDIRTCCRPETDAYTRVAGSGELVTWHGSTFPVIRLHALFDVSGAVSDPAGGVLVVVSDGVRACALLVDEVLGQHQFVARPVAPGLGAVPGVSGTAILGDGAVGLILDAAGLLAAR